MNLTLPDHCSVDWIVYHGGAQTMAEASNEDPQQLQHLTLQKSNRLISEALQRPIGTPALSAIARGKRNAVILISDITRLCPSNLLLPFLLRELNEAGVSDQFIKVIVALGSHRKQTEQELIELVGAHVYARVAVHNHSALPEDCTVVGTTSVGTIVELNSDVVRAELRIAVGNIEPHALVGMSGGVKALFPGTASLRSIEQNHALSQSHPSIPGRTDNAIHRDLTEALSFVPIHFVCNVIVNHRKEVLAAVAGDILEAHRAGAAEAEKHFFVHVGKRYDLVIASAGGAPKDIHLYQAVKTLQNAAAFTKPGGQILLIVQCGELYGNGIFQYWVETVQDQNLIAQKLQERFVLGAHKIAHIRNVLEHHTVYLYSTVPDSIARLLGFHPINDLTLTVQSLAQPSHDIAIMPVGALTFPLTNKVGSGSPLI